MDLFRGDRTRDIPDEVLIAQQKQAEIEAAEASRDQTFEEFKFKYEDHIEGKAANTRVARQSNFGDDVKSARSKSMKGRSRRGVSQSGRDDDDDAKSQKSRKADQEVVDQINQELDQLKFVIPASCMMNLNKNLRIEKLEGKYQLLAHPAPSFEGEMLLIQPKREDQDDADLVVYRDYSLRKRIPNRDRVISATENIKVGDKKKKEQEISKLQCLEVAIEEPIVDVEWVNIAEIMNQVKGLCWFQVLPVG